MSLLEHEAEESYPEFEEPESDDFISNMTED
jgi:hypothetical protein